MGYCPRFHGLKNVESKLSGRSGVGHWPILCSLSAMNGRTFIDRGMLWIAECSGVFCWAATLGC